MGILEAFKFVEDRLYQFQYRDKLGRPRVASHPSGNEEPFADELRLIDLDLAIDQVMELDYDPESQWKFIVRLERADLPDSEVKSVKLIEKHGQSPPIPDEIA